MCIILYRYFKPRVTCFYFCAIAFIYQIFFFPSSFNQFRRCWKIFVKVSYHLDVNAEFLPGYNIMTAVIALCSRPTKEHFICGMPRIISNFCKIRSSSWQQAKGWRHGWRRESCKHVDGDLTDEELVDSKFVMEYIVVNIAAINRCLREAWGI